MDQKPIPMEEGGRARGNIQRSQWSTCLVGLDQARIPTREEAERHRRSGEAQRTEAIAKIQTTSEWMRVVVGGFTVGSKLMGMAAVLDLPRITMAM
jgi:hypothetical protein